MGVHHVRVLRRTDVGEKKGVLPAPKVSTWHKHKSEGSPGRKGGMHER